MGGTGEGPRLLASLSETPCKANVNSRLAVPLPPVGVGLPVNGGVGEPVTPPVTVGVGVLVGVTVGVLVGVGLGVGVGPVHRFLRQSLDAH